MTSFPDEQPLSRKQMRERNRVDDSVVDDLRPQSATTTEPVGGGDVSATPPAPVAAPTPVELPAGFDPNAPFDSTDQPVTRRQAREIERARTAALAIVTAAQVEAAAVSRTTDAAAAPAAEPAAPAPVAAAPVSAVPVSAVPVSAAAPVGAVPLGAAPVGAVPASVVPSAYSPAPAPAPTLQPPIAHQAPVVAAPVVDSKPAKVSKRQQKAERVAAEKAARDAAPQNASIGGPVGGTQAPAFGAGIAQAGSEAPQPQAFDAVLPGPAPESIAVTTANALIMPSSTGPVSVSGEAMVTGSIDLPAVMSSTGAAPTGFDRADMDAVLDKDGNAPATAGTPISASKAVSTHTSTREVITPTTKTNTSKLLMILAITAGVLCVAVLTVVIVGLVSGAF